jgi:hypothetical protein
MLYMTSGNLKEGMFGEYQAWLKKNAKQVQQHAPKGWKYKGTYGSVLGFGKYDVTDIWEIRNYGDFDKLRNHTDSVFNRLTAESLDFFTPGSGRAELLREMSDVVFVEPKKKRR